MKQMIKQTTIGKLITLGAMLVIAGCAQLSPQQISFEPTIPTDGLIEGTGTISLSVKDMRSSDVIGIRGGSYAQTSTITPKEPLTIVVESIASQILQRGGFELTTSLPDQSMEIQITELNFKTTDEGASVKLNTASASVLVVVNKGSVTQKSQYNASQNIKTLGYPNDEENEKLLNDVFDSVLERLFRDPKLEAFLQ